MEHTVYLEFDEDSDAVDIYNVQLASENPSDNYGILDITTGQALVAWETTVTPNPTGTYSYTFTAVNGHLYLVSWQVTINAGENPTYKTDQVGPFFSVNNDDVRAVASFGGKFVQDSLATMMLKITDFEGNAQDAEDISVSIYDSNGTTVSLDNTTPEHTDTGFYVYDWTIDADQPIGEYTVVWDYVVDDIQKAEIQNIVVSADATDTVRYSGRLLEFRLALEHHLGCAQSIPVYYEQAKPSRDNKIFRFSFPDWNQSTGVIVYRNENIVNEGVEVDYFKGEVVFDEAITSHETVNADYNFRWFSDEKLNRFLHNAIQTVNNAPPASGYSLLDVPDRFIPAILYGAAKDALRYLMGCILLQQPAQVFGGLEQARAAFANLETLKQNYEKDWEYLLEQKKFGPYPRTRIIVTPEYTLPGGRSRWFRYLFKGL